MTLLATTRETQIRNLLALSSEDFGTLVKNNLGEEDQPALWLLLADPLVVRRTYTALTTIYTDICDQLAIRSAYLDAFKSECHERGGQGKQEFFDELGSYSAWRARVLGYRRLLNRRIAAIKPEAAKAGNPPRIGKQIPKVMPPEKKVRLVSTIYQLASAIELHREVCDDAGIIAEQHDLDLWAALDEVQVQTAVGLIPVAQMLNDVASKPDLHEASEDHQSTTIAAARGDS